MKNSFRLSGNVLYFTRDTKSIKDQLSGSEVNAHAKYLSADLMDDISTDEMTPGWCCFRYDEKLGDYAFLGLRDNVVTEGSVRAFSPQILVSGHAKGCGSSREHAVYAEKFAGVEIVFARSFSKIYEQNCRNVGIITSTDFSILEKLIAGEEVSIDAFVKNLNPIERAIVKSGGLFEFNAQNNPLPVEAAPASEETRPLNIVERIIHSRLSGRYPEKATPAIQVGSTYFLRADIRFSHEYVTPMAANIFKEKIGDGAKILEPETCYFFQDHLSLSKPVLEKRPRGATFIPLVEKLNGAQHQFAELQGGHFIGLGAHGGSKAICHNYILENVAMPGQLIIGTDSHTCTAGAMGALAFGVGATDIANAWFNKEILVKVPSVIKVELTGRLPRFCCAKDVMLKILASETVQKGGTGGSVLFFTGEGCAHLQMDERATLCNMAVEAGAITALFTVDDVTRAYLTEMRGIDSDDIAYDQTIETLSEACYKQSIRIAMDEIIPMISLPGDPKYTREVGKLESRITINRAYGGSCTGGKIADMDMYAEVFSMAKARGLKVHPNVGTYFQVGSESVLNYIKERGYIDLFEELGATVLPPSCGACINAGPGVSETASDVTVSAQNRNFPGRSGPGQVYLASPYVVATSSIAGYLTTVADFFPEAL